MPSASNTSLVSHFDCPGGGQVWVDGTTLYIAHMEAPYGTTIVDVADPKRPRELAHIDIPDGWHSHKVRVANGIMIVNHEKLGQSGDACVRRRARHLRRVEARRPRSSSPSGRHRRPRRAPLRFRRPLRLYLADRRRLCRQHRDDPRSQGSGEAGRGRALVDSGPVEGRRRALSLGQLGDAALPSSDAHGRPALCQLLASRLLHPRHLRHVEAEGDRAYQHQPGVPASDPHLPADAQAAQGPQDHDRGRRGRGEASALAALLHLDLRHHRSSNCRCRSRPSRCRASTRTAARSRR